MNNIKQKLNKWWYSQDRVSNWISCFLPTLYGIIFGINRLFDYIFASAYAEGVLGLLMYLIILPSFIICRCTENHFIWFRLPNEITENKHIQRIYHFISVVGNLTNLVMLYRFLTN